MLNDTPLVCAGKPILPLFLSRGMEVVFSPTRARMACLATYEPPEMEVGVVLGFPHL